MALKELSKSFREFFLAGIDWVMASGKKSQGMNAFSITSGGSPDSVVFADLALPDMADADYQVLCDGETVARVTVDESSKTAFGFDILGGAGAEVIHVVVVGRIEGQPEE